MILVIGYFNGILMTFAYLYLRLEMGASQLCLGACVVTTVVVEVPILFVGGKIVDKVINIYMLTCKEYECMFIFICYVLNGMVLCRILNLVYKEVPTSWLIWIIYDKYGWTCTCWLVKISLAYYGATPQVFRLWM